MFNTCTIKNLNTSNETVLGVVLAQNEVYTIPSEKRIAASKDSSILDRISSGALQIGDGTNFFSSTADQTAYLLGTNPVTIDTETPVRMYALSEAANLRARLIGIYNQTVTQNTTTNLDWQIPQTAWLGVNKQGYMDGIEYYAKDAELGDTMKFQVVDKDGLVYPAGTVLDEFGSSWGVVPDYNTTIRLYKAKLIPGMYIRVAYTSTSTTTDPHIMCNLFRHMDTATDI